MLSPTVTIHTIGAGGGSVAYIEAGALRVGPRSAGAVPGPACYRPRRHRADRHRRERRPRPAARARLGWEDALELDVDAAAAAVESVAEPLGLERIAAARGIVAVADAAMANAIREITCPRGIDPRDFSLLRLRWRRPAARRLRWPRSWGIPSVVVPANPGVLSAWGMLHTDTRHDLVHSFFVAARRRSSPSQLRSALDGAARAEESRSCARTASPTRRWSSFPAADLRYVGPGVRRHHPAGRSTTQPDAVIGFLPDRFAAAHLDRYGHNNPGERVECVNLRSPRSAGSRRSPRRSGSPGRRRPGAARLDEHVLRRRLARRRTCTGAATSGPDAAVRRPCRPARGRLHDADPARLDGARRGRRPPPRGAARWHGDLTPSPSRSSATRSTRSRRR